MEKDGERQRPPSLSICYRYPAYLKLYSLSLHDALPITPLRRRSGRDGGRLLRRPAGGPRGRRGRWRTGFRLRHTVGTLAGSTLRGGRERQPRCGGVVRPAAAGDLVVVRVDVVALAHISTFPSTSELSRRPTPGL